VVARLFERRGVVHPIRWDPCLAAGVYLRKIHGAGAGAYLGNAATPSRLARKEEPSWNKIRTIVGMVSPSS
jgi:hypothetical protein